jgi:hypothetical protein
VTATDATAMTAIAVAGEVYWATAPAMAAPTPCMASIPADCRPRACPDSSSGVRASRRRCSRRLAEYPTEATVTAITATTSGGCHTKIRNGTPSSRRNGPASRSRQWSVMKRPVRVSPASIPSAANVNSTHASSGSYDTNSDSQPTINPFGTHSAR